MDWVTSFLNFTERTPSPAVLRRWAAIAGISGALERRVWTYSAGKNVYPNLYVFLVAAPAVGKTVAIDPVGRLWTETKKLHVAPNNLTRAALVDALNRSSRDFLTKSGLYDYHSLLVPCRELGVLISSYDLSFLSILNDIYDNPPSYREERRMLEGRQIDIINPHITLLAAAQPDFLAAVLPEEAWGQGFMSRVIMIFSATPRALADPFDETPEDTGLHHSLLDHIEALGECYGGFVWHPAAKADFSQWYRHGFPPKPDHIRLQHYASRRVIHVMKLAMCSSASRGTTLVLTPEDMDRARAWLLDAEGTMPDVFRAMMSRSDVQTLRELHFYMWRAWMVLPPDQRKPIPDGVPWEWLAERVPSERVSHILGIAEKSGLLKKTPHGWTPRPITEVNGSAFLKE